MSGIDLLRQPRTRRPTLVQKTKAFVRFADATDADDEQPDANLTVAQLVADEMTRGPAANRALLRAAGRRSGYSRRRYVLGQQARQEAKLDAIEADPVRLAQHQLKRSEAAKRRERKAQRLADRRARLGIS